MWCEAIPLLIKHSQRRATQWNRLLSGGGYGVGRAIGDPRNAAAYHGIVRQQPCIGVALLNCPRVAVRSDLPDREHQQGVWREVAILDGEGQPLIEPTCHERFW
jgi:hypothetical protein